MAWLVLLHRITTLLKTTSFYSCLQCHRYLLPIKQWLAVGTENGANAIQTHARMCDPSSTRSIWWFMHTLRWWASSVPTPFFVSTTDRRVAFPPRFLLQRLPKQWPTKYEKCERSVFGHSSSSFSHECTGIRAKKQLACDVPTNASYFQQTYVWTDYKVLSCLFLPLRHNLSWSTLMVEPRPRPSSSTKAIVSNFSRSANTDVGNYHTQMNGSHLDITPRQGGCEPPSPTSVGSMKHSLNSEGAHYLRVLRPADNVAKMDPTMSSSWQWL